MKLRSDIKKDIEYIEENEQVLTALLQQMPSDSLDTLISKTSNTIQKKFALKILDRFIKQALYCEKGTQTEQYSADLTAVDVMQMQMRKFQNDNQRNLSEVQKYKNLLQDANRAITEHRNKEDEFVKQLSALKTQLDKQEINFKLELDLTTGELNEIKAFNEKNKLQIKKLTNQVEMKDEEVKQTQIKSRNLELLVDEKENAIIALQDYIKDLNFENKKQIKEFGMLDIKNKKLDQEKIKKELEVIGGS